MNDIYQIECSRDYNQKFFTSLNGHKVALELRTFRGVIYATIDIDGERATTGIKAISGVNLLGSAVARTIGGNIRFVTIDGRYPAPEDFDGHTCCLLYFEGEY